MRRAEDVQNTRRALSTAVVFKAKFLCDRVALTTLVLGQL
jgi:hypothetical protein